MEYWRLLEILDNKEVNVYKIDELEGKFHWTMGIDCDCRVFYVGIDFENVEMVCKELTDD